MKRVLFAACLLATPLRAYSQAHCAIPAAPEATAAHATAVSPHAPPAAQAATTTATAQKPSDQIPDLFRHVVAAGAQITDLGVSHGMKSVLARNGDQFMIFLVTPDNKAMVSGLMVDTDLATLKKIGGAGLSELSTEHGLRGFFLRNGDHFQVFYATPDEQRMIPGVMWDAAGKDITRTQIAAIPGTQPTITIGDVNQKGGAAGDALQLAQSAAFGSVGDKRAPTLWMIIDPQCSFSIRAMQQLNPYVVAGRVHLNIIPVSVLDHEDAGLSTRRAEELLSVSADALAKTWENGATAQTNSDSVKRLQENMVIAEAIRLRGTPTFLWKKTDGTIGRADGLPQDLDAVLRSIKG